MAKKKSFLLYTDLGMHFKKLSDEDAGMLIKAVFDYQENGVTTVLPPVADMLYGMICTQIDRDNEKWAKTCAKRADAANKRYQKDGSNTANASKSMQMHANASDNDSDNENENDNENDSESENESVINRAPPAAPATEPEPTQEPTKPDNTIKRPRGEFGKAMLTDAEYQRWQEIRPDDWEPKLLYFDRYLARTGKTYANHYLTLLDWAEEDDKKAAAQQKQDTSVHFDLDKKNKGKYDDIFTDPWDLPT